jgi:hypothetical protein
MYNSKMTFLIGAIFAILALSACQKNDTSKTAQTQPPVSPLTDYRQKISMKTPITVMKPGTVVKTIVRITNIGSEVWPTAGTSPVNLAYHWIDRSKNIVVFDGERTALPKDLNSGESVKVEATIKSPDQPGEYMLRMTMVQEQVAWFDDRGAKALNYPVTVK